MYMYLCIELDASKCKVINTLVILNKFTGTPPNILVISNEWAWVSHSSQMSVRVSVSVPLISNERERECTTHFNWDRVSHSSVWIFLNNSINVFWRDAQCETYIPYSPGVPSGVPSWKTLKMKLCEDIHKIDYIIQKYIYFIILENFSKYDIVILFHVIE